MVKRLLDWLFSGNVCPFGYYEHHTCPKWGMYHDH